MAQEVVKASPSATAAAGSAPAGFGSFLAAGKGFIFPHNRSGEDRLFITLVIVSAMIHLGFLLLDDFSWIHEKPVLTDEWTMDADLISDLDMSSPMKSALPKAEVAPEAKVAAELLPQLPKKFSVKEETKPEEAVAEEKEKEVPKEAKPDEKEKKAEELNLKTENKEDNKMNQAEILKRAALMRLMAEDKLAKTNEAPENDKLARLAEELNKSQKKVNSGFASAASKGKIKKYGAMIKQAVRTNYSLPEAYNLKGANMKIMISITVGASGDLLDLDVNQPSGDQVFDELTVQAVRASVPLPKPPKELAGEAIVLVFTP
jgi:TolA protein